MSQHIVKAYDSNLEYLHDMIMRMGQLSISFLEQSLQALEKREAKLAQKVISGDDEIDALEGEIYAFCIKMIALRQPMASDLRDILSAIKIASELERIGDYASNVAKRAISLSQIAQTPITKNIMPLGACAIAMLKDIMRAYKEQDIALAYQVWQKDTELDTLYNDLFTEALNFMVENKESVSSGTHIMFTAKNIERIGDHATNIAETIHYWITGTPLKSERPKSDVTSYMLGHDDFAKLS